MPDNLRHAQYGNNGVQIDAPQLIWTPPGTNLVTGTVYQEDAVPAVGTRLAIFTGGTGIVDDATQGTTESTQFQFTVKAGWIGKNDGLRICPDYVTTNSAAAKRCRGRFGGNVLWNWDLTTHLWFKYCYEIRNQNALNIQSAQANSTTYTGPIGSVGEQTFNIDFSVDQVFTLTLQFPVAGTGTNSLAGRTMSIWKI